jgi:hypothetical protein
VSITEINQWALFPWKEHTQMVDLFADSTFERKFCYNCLDSFFFHLTNEHSVIANKTRYFTHFCKNISLRVSFMPCRHWKRTVVADWYGRYWVLTSRVCRHFDRELRSTLGIIKHRFPIARIKSNLKSFIWIRIQMRSHKSGHMPSLYFVWRPPPPRGGGGGGVGGGHRPPQADI